MFKPIMLERRVTYKTLNEKIYADALEKYGDWCGICGKTAEQLGSDSMSRKKLIIDHDHETGKMRGVLCVRCNIGLGQAGDSERFLLAALAYLRRRTAND